MTRTKDDGGPFGVPEGVARMEDPDGNSIAYDNGDARGSLRNAAWACGGPDGGGYGWENHDTDAARRSHGSDVIMVDGRRSGKFRIG